MPPSRVSKSHKHTRMPDWFVESFVGTLLVAALGLKIYPEEQSDFELPERYRRNKDENLNRQSSDSTLVPNDSQQSQDARNGDNASESSRPNIRKRNTNEVERGQGGQEKSKDSKEKEKDKDKDQEKKGGPPSPEEDPNIVTWYGDKDPANPQNWSLFKKCFVTGELCLLTFSIYIGSAIYSPGYRSIRQEFGISQIEATLGLTLFVIGYGIGPLFLSASSEIPAVGRNPPYMITLAIFVILQVPTALAPNIQSFLVLRFLAGFIGSPVLATGGASLGDLYNAKTRPYAIGIWGLSAVCGPVLGPLIGGFAIQANGWRWAFWILLWLDGFCLIALIFAMPETSANTILYRRAKRLRKLTGNDKLKSQGEIVGEGMTFGAIVNMTLISPFVLTFTEPIVFALDLYIGLVYAILYCFIESFQLVFVEMYDFNLAENGLAFVGLLVGGVVSYICFCFYNAYGTIPKIRASDGELAPEERLPVACFGSFSLPIALFIFGWCSNPSIPWIVPIIGSAFFSFGVFLLFQSVLNYLGDAYPEKAPSVYASNDFVRSMMGAAFPIFSSQMFRNLGHGVAWGSTLLGCLTVLFIPIPFALYKYGRNLRMRSKSARHDI